MKTNARCRIALRATLLFATALIVHNAKGTDVPGDQLKIGANLTLNPTNLLFNTIAGGNYNNNSSYGYSSISGGYNNFIEAGTCQVISGGINNAIRAGTSGYNQ